MSDPIFKHIETDPRVTTTLWRCLTCPNAGLVDIQPGFRQCLMCRRVYVIAELERGDPATETP